MAGSQACCDSGVYPNLGPQVSVDVSVADVFELVNQLALKNYCLSSSGEPISIGEDDSDKGGGRAESWSVTLGDSVSAISSEI